MSISVSKAESWQDFEDSELRLSSTRLEKEYEKSLADASQILNAERLRRSCVENLLLQIENDTLQLKLSLKDDELVRKAREESDTQLQLQAAQSRLNQLEATVKASSSQIEHLRNDVASLNHRNLELQNAVAEKSRLAKELSSAHAEIAQLKTHDASTQGVLAQKLNLERLCNSLELKLEDERRSHERTRAKEARSVSELTGLSKELDEVRRNLADEVRSRQLLEESLDKQTESWEAERTLLEKKSESLMKKLQSAKNRLHKIESEAKDQRSGSVAEERYDGNSRIQDVPLIRPGIHFNPDMTIATPGAVQVREGARKSALIPGDKSSFSITPFLNRTSAPTHSPTSSDNENNELHEISFNMDRSELQHKKQKVNGAINAANLKAGEKVSLNDLSDSNGRQNSQKRRVKVTATSRGRTDYSRNEDGPGTTALHQAIGEGNIKAKKRKLGGQRDRNLFEDEDDGLDTEEPKRAGRKLGVNLARPLIAFGSLQNSRAGPAQFSPLKRDRKRI